MYNPVSGTFKIAGKTYSNFRGEFSEAVPVITAYLDLIGGSPDEDDDFWGLPDDDALVVSSEGKIGILSSGKFFS